MTDRELLQNITESERKKLLNRWWDKVFLVLGILGALFCLLVIISMTPEDRADGGVVAGVIIFFVLPAVILLLIGLRKKLFWSKEKQDAYIVSRLGKQTLRENAPSVIEVTSANDTVTEVLPKEEQPTKATEMSSEPEPIPAPVTEQEEPEAVTIEEPKAEVAAEEEEDQEIILFPEV